MSFRNSKWCHLLSGTLEVKFGYSLGTYGCCHIPERCVHVADWSVKEAKRITGKIRNNPVIL